MNTVKTQVKKGYLIKMSVGFEIQIEEDELNKAILAINTGKPMRFKRGIIRGDLIAGIIEDGERVVVEKLDPDTGERHAEMKPLGDVFKGVEFKQLKPDDKKLLE